MSRPPPPLNFIRSFESAARHLSFTRAAQELGYTQAAISIHVRALEKYLGRALFNRSARSIELTEMGEAFLPTLRQALSLIDSATDAIAKTGGQQSVVIVSPMSLAENWLPGCLHAFRQQNPGVECTVLGTIWEAAEPQIADIILSVRRDDEVPTGAVQLRQETLSLVCSPAMAAAASGDFKCLLAGPRIMVSGRQEFWRIVERALDAPPSEGQIVARTNGSNVSLELAVEGVGATIAMTSLARKYLDRGLLVEPLAIRPASPWGYWIARRSVKKGSAPGRLYQFMLDYAGRLPPG